jgi:hypothetical protein
MHILKPGNTPTTAKLYWEGALTNTNTIQFFIFNALAQQTYENIYPITNYKWKHIQKR